MKMMAFGLTVIVALILFYGVGSWQKKSQARIITIGSGSESAMFYPVANALCEVFNKYNQDKTFICQAKLSKGAEYNLDAVESGEFDMGIAQANLQYDAYNGLNKFANNPLKNLRTLFNVHNEYLTIIAKKDADIKNFADLRGKKVNIGNSGSGSRILFAQIIDKLGWNLSDFEEVYEESGSNINKVLCVPDKADAAVYIVGHPNKSFRSMVDDCDTKLVSLSDDEISSFVSLSPKEFYKSYIPENTYSKSPQKVDTFASKTVLTTSTKLDKKFVQNFVQIISKHKEELINIQPALSVIIFSTENDPNLAPLHEGLMGENNL